MSAMSRDEMTWTKTSDNESKDRGYSKIWNTTINLIQQEQGGLAMTRDNLDVGNVEFDNSKDKVCIHTGRNTTIN